MRQAAGIEKKSAAVLFLTHFLSDDIKKAFTRIENSAECDCFLILHIGGKEEEPVPDWIQPDRFIALSNSELLKLPYPRKCDPKGWSGAGWHVIDNVDTLVLAFFRRFPGYTHYWGIEYDVHFTGDWCDLLDHYAQSKSDIIGVVMEPRATTPFLNLAPNLCDENGNALPEERTIRGFFPLFRATRLFLETMDRLYVNGWNGHYELSWATCAVTNGLTVEAFSGRGPYVLPNNIDRYYFNTPSRWDLAPGTFIYTPVLPCVLPLRNVLWHPYKPGGQFYRHSARSSDRNIFVRIKRLIKLTTIYLFTVVWAIRNRRLRGSTGANGATNHL